MAKSESMIRNDWLQGGLNPFEYHELFRLEESMGTPFHVRDYACPATPCGHHNFQYMCCFREARPPPRVKMFTSGAKSQLRVRCFQMQSASQKVVLKRIDMLSSGASRAQPGDALAASARLKKIVAARAASATQRQPLGSLQANNLDSKRYERLDFGPVRK